jgi:hypothetical protein
VRDLPLLPDVRRHGRGIVVTDLVHVVGVIRRGTPAVLAVLLFATHIILPLIMRRLTSAIVARFTTGPPVVRTPFTPATLIRERRTGNDRATQKQQ